MTDVNDQNDMAVASYNYDFLGRRASKTVYGSPDVTTKYCYDGGQVIAEYDGSDNLLRKFVYGPGIDEPICLIDVDGGNVVYYYHFDGLGSVAALSDVNNVIVERYSYDVFGAPTIYDANSSEIPQSAIGNPYMFTARRADDETALYYYRARYYAFDIGRFLQTDPIGYLGGLNLYTYCGNNPCSFVDPLGLLYTYSAEKTQRELDKAIAISGEGGILVGPWNAFGIGGECDYWGRFTDERGVYFLLPNGQNELLAPSEFGNYTAGYGNAYNYGKTGEIGTRIAGDVFALMGGHLLDDAISTYWINRGVTDANLRRMREIFGPLYGMSPEEVIQQQVSELLQQNREYWEELYQPLFPQLHEHTDISKKGAN